MSARAAPGHAPALPRRPVAVAASRGHRGPSVMLRSPCEVATTTSAKGSGSGISSRFYPCSAPREGSRRAHRYRSGSRTNDVGRLRGSDEWFDDALEAAHSAGAARRDRRRPRLCTALRWRALPAIRPSPRRLGARSSNPGAAGSARTRDRRERRSTWPHSPPLPCEPPPPAALLAQMLAGQEPIALGRDGLQGRPHGGDVTTSARAFAWRRSAPREARASLVRHRQRPRSRLRHRGPLAMRRPAPAVARSGSSSACSARRRASRGRRAPSRGLP